MSSSWQVRCPITRVTPVSPTDKPGSHAGQWYLEIASWLFWGFFPLSKVPNIFLLALWHIEINHSSIKFLLGLELKIWCQSKQNQAPSLLQWPNFAMKTQGFCGSSYCWTCLSCCSSRAITLISFIVCPITTGSYTAQWPLQKKNIMRGEPGKCNKAFFALLVHVG